MHIDAYLGMYIDTSWSIYWYASSHIDGLTGCIL